MRYKYCLALFLILLACDNSKYETQKCDNKHKTLEYAILKNLSINVTNAQYQHVATQTLISNNTLYYYALDIERNSIDIFNLTSSQLDTTIVINSDGPNAVAGLSYMKVISPDSIYLMATYTNQLYLINSHAEVKQKWNFNNIDLPDSLRNSPNSAQSYSLLGLAMPEFYNLPFWISKDGKELRAIINYDNTYQDNREFTYQYHKPPIVHFNLQKNQFIDFDGKYPSIYFKKYRPHNAFHRFIVVNGYDILSFTSSDLLFFSNTKNFVCARSKFDPRKLTLFEEGNEQDDEAEVNSYVTEGTYSGLINDPYRKRIYRIYSHPQEKLNLEGKLNRKNETNWSILVLDYKGNLIGEVQFESGIYDYFNINAVPEGLLLSRENSSNPDNIEDLLEFDIIKILETN